MIDVVGYCPMGCGQTLFVGEGGHVTCSFVECPEPAAVDEILGDGDSRHLVKIEKFTFSVQHPLRERLNSESLFDCTVHQQIKAKNGPPMPPGLYRVTVAGNGSIVGWEATDPPTQ